MNAETEMAGADGLGAAPSDDKARCDDCRRIWPVAELVEPERLSERLDPGGTVPAGECPECGALAYPVEAEPADPLDELAKEIGYSDGADDDESGGVDALIDYKNALEDRCRQLENSLGEIGHCLPKNESWDGGPGRLEDIAAILDRGLVERPNTSEYERH